MACGYSFYKLDQSQKKLTLELGQIRNKRASDDDLILNALRLLFLVLLYQGKVRFWTLNYHDRPILDPGLRNRASHTPELTKPCIDN